MVDPVDPTKSGSVPQDSPKPPANPMQPPSSSESGSSHKVPEWVKKLCPGATEQQQEQFYSNWIKSISAEIAQNQKFHEEQREQRKEESGDDDGEL